MFQAMATLKLANSLCIVVIVAAAVRVREVVVLVEIVKTEHRLMRSEPGAVAELLWRTHAGSKRLCQGTIMTV